MTATLFLCSQGVVIENYQSKYNAKDIYLSDSEIMDEIAADYTKNILSDPQSMQKFIDDALNGKVDTTASISENRNILQKLFDSIKEFIKKVSDKFSGRKAEQNQAARDAYGVDLETLKQAKNLLQKALRDSADVVADKNANVHLSEKDARKVTEEKKRYSIKGVDKKANSGYAIKGKYNARTLKLSENEYAKFITSVNTDYNNPQKTHERLQYQSCVTDEAHTLYIYEDFGFDNYNVIAKLDFANEDLINNVIEVIDNGNFESVSDVFSEMFKSTEIRQGGYSIYNTNTGRRRAAKADVAVHSGLSRNNESEGIDGTGGRNSRPRNGINTRKNSIKMDEDILRKHENLKKAYAKMAADFSRLKRENREFRQGKIATVAKKLLKDFDFAYDSDLLTEKMSGLSEDTKQMIAGNISKTTYKLIVGCFCDS